MTDPAQVAEPVSWWQAALALLGTTGFGLALAAIARAFGIRSSAAARVQVAQVQAQTSREADASAKHTLDAQLDAQADAADHSLAVTVADRERAERLDIQGKHFNCLELVRQLETKLVTCEVKHANAEARAQWFERRLDLLDGGEKNPSVPAPPTPQPTPEADEPRDEPRKQ